MIGFTVYQILLYINVVEINSLKITEEVLQ